MISVVIPVYNGEKYIKRCIESVFKQTYSEIEVIVINDGSEDSTESICREFQCHENFRICSFENHGVSWARNKGIEYARGEYIIFIDADDTLNEQMFQKMIEVSSNADLVICGIKCIDHCNATEKHNNIGDGTYNISDYLEQLSHSDINMFFGGPYNKLYKRKTIEEKRILFEVSQSFMEDLCFNLDYLAYCDTVYVLSECLYEYHKNDNENSLCEISFSPKVKDDEFLAYVLNTYEHYKSLLLVHGCENDYRVLCHLWYLFLLKVRLGKNLSSKIKINYAKSRLRNHKEIYNIRKMKAKTIQDWKRIIISTTFLGLCRYFK